jgi:deazaflavin-dependent oxidoreductase (nitroreductase family)
MTVTASRIEPLAPAEGLPYGPRMTRALGPLHRVFDLVNRWLALPILHAGLGPLLSTPLTGSIMVLRTTGRRSGLPREAPLGYVIREGCVYCCAGFGVGTAWYRNLVANPRVEVLLPTIAFAGLAEPVTDRAEWDRIYPAYARALGLVGRMTLGEVGAATDEQLDAIWRTLPLVRVRPTGLATGPADPGGGIWVVAQGLLLAVLARLVLGAARRVRSGGKS